MTKQNQGDIRNQPLPTQPVQQRGGHDASQARSDWGMTKPDQSRAQGTDGKVKQ